jgi:hypothetical protein
VTPPEPAPVLIVAYDGPTGAYYLVEQASGRRVAGPFPTVMPRWSTPGSWRGGASMGRRETHVRAYTHMTLGDTSGTPRRFLAEHAGETTRR